MSEVNLDDLLSRGLDILQAEIKLLQTQVLAGKGLSKDGQTALVSYIRLLRELKKEENELLDNLSDEELERVAKNGR